VLARPANVDVGEVLARRWGRSGQDSRILGLKNKG
jgi:hypothetical protein